MTSYSRSARFASWGTVLVAAIGLTAGGAAAVTLLDAPALEPTTTVGAPVLQEPQGEPLQFSGALSSDAEAIPELVGGRQARLAQLNIDAVKVVQTASGSSIRLVAKGFAGTVEEVWLAGLAAGAEAEILSGGQGVYSVVVRDASVVGHGDEPVGLGVGAIAMGQHFDSPTPDVLKLRVDDVAARFGLSVTEQRVIQPRESALHVTFAVPDDLKPAWSIEDLRAALVGQPHDVEGIFIRLVSSSGKPLLETGSAYRTGESGLWFAPGQDTRFGALHGTQGAPSATGMTP